MEFEVFEVSSQVYIIPTFKITYDKWLHGKRDVQFIWLKWGIALLF